jgi:Arc/MetJ-type ribon-helix-helix transcriptional regulator
MSSSLSNDSEAFIADAIARGAYRTREEVLEAGVERLRRPDPLIERLKEGRRQLDEGEFVDFDEAGLRQFFEQLKERARSAAEAK